MSSAGTMLILSIGTPRFSDCRTTGLRAYAANAAGLAEYSSNSSRANESEPIVARGYSAAAAGATYGSAATYVGPAVAATNVSTANGSARRGNDADNA